MNNNELTMNETINNNELTMNHNNELWWVLNQRHVN